MVDPNTPFVRRDLLRDLPELLEGPEPVLSSSKAREYIHRDVLSRSIIVAASEMARAMRIGADRIQSLSRRGEGAAPHAASVAKRYFSRELIEVLFDTALFYVRRATRNSSCYLRGLSDSDDELPEVEATRTRVERLVEELGFSLSDFEEGAMIRDVLSLDLAEDPPSDLHLAESLLESCDRLAPDLDGVVYWRKYLKTLRGGTTTSEEWVECARRAGSQKAAGRALLAAANEAIREQDPARALELDKAADRLLSQSPVLAYNGVRHAALAGESQAAWHFLQRFEESCGDQSIAVSWLKRSNHEVRDEWRGAKSRNPTVFEDVIAQFPTELSVSLLEEVQ